MSTKEQVYRIIDELDEEKLNALLLLLGNNEKNTSESKSKTEDEVELLMGIFSECTNPDLIPLEKKAWERAAIEKYENP